MAFGKHWEWRGFGDPGGPALRAIEALPLKFPRAQVVTDRYLWAGTGLPLACEGRRVGSPINVKLRFGDLKFKRLLESSGEFECWLEDEAENYRFPIAPEILEKLCGELGISLPRFPDAAVDSKCLLEILRDAKPAVRLVEVKKRRWQREWRPPEGRGEPGGVIVEAAEVLSPEKILSIGLEHPLRKMVAAAREALSLSQGLKGLSYMAAVAIWGGGGKIG